MRGTTALENGKHRQEQDNDRAPWEADPQGKKVESIKPKVCPRPWKKKLVITAQNCKLKNNHIRVNFK